MYTIYILLCSDNTLYTGITNDIEARMKKHSEGKGAKYVRARLPFKLVYTEKVESKSEALKREFAIKRLSRTEKLELIKGVMGNGL
jgi:putative endonuclease